MIVQKKKICKTCQTEQYIFSHGNCKQCASKNYKVNKVSEKQATTNKLLSDIYKMMDTTEKKCFFCGCTNKPLDHVHLIRRSYSAELIIHPLNIVFGCRECHTIFDDKPNERSALNNYDKALKRIKLLDEKYYNKISE